MRSSCLVECLAMAGSRRARAITSRVMGLIKSPIQVLQVTSSLAGSLWRWSLAGFNCPILDWVFVLIRSSVKSNPMASLFGFPWSRDSAFGVNWYFLPNITSVVWHHVEVRGTAAHAVAVKHHFGVNASGPREGDQRSHWSCPNPSGPPPPPSGVAGEQEIFGTNCRETGTSVVGNPGTFGTSRAGKTALKSEMVGSSRKLGSGIPGWKSGVSWPWIWHLSWPLIWHLSGPWTWELSWPEIWDLWWSVGLGKNHGKERGRRRRVLILSVRREDYANNRRITERRSVKLAEK